MQLRIANANNFFMRSENISIPPRKKNLDTYMSLVLALGQFEVVFASNWQKPLNFLSNPWYFVVYMPPGFDKKTLFFANWRQNQLQIDLAPKLKTCKSQDFFYEQVCYFAGIS